MKTAIGAPRVIHLLVGVAAACDTDDAKYVSSNRDIVTCPACFQTQVAPEEPEPETVEPVPSRFSVDVSTPDELRAWRARHKLSQRGLAKLLDMSWTTVFRWEKGSWPIPRTASFALAYLEQHLLP